MYIISRQESYTEKEIENFKKIIIDWCENFKKIFSSLSKTECSFPKLHSWKYHTVAAVRKYGVLNGLSTETYETLHKTYVKNPYQSSNRKNIMQQLIKAVKRKEITPVASKIIHRKTKGFGKILWNFNLDEIEQKVDLLKNSKNPPHSNLIEGLLQVIPALDTFLDTSSQSSECDDFCIIVYDAVHLDNGEILRTSGNFQGNEWFSNVSVSPAKDQVSESTDRIWYGKILLLLRLFQGLLKEPYDLAIVRWYDILLEESELYGCLHLYFFEEYNAIPLDLLSKKILPFIVCK
ncbi:hypothetical protein C2G38_2216737 [Gigaspora rosea]|uniref:Uncharacterized protein n=1 Tax=Gigaspora rosea TaxID=44941 RepID=A0A397UBT7_9GLOM|nr:hypothetical protein C2G38_2216737 [Gigaspora rosea]